MDERVTVILVVFTGLQQHPPLRRRGKEDRREGRTGGQPGWSRSRRGARTRVPDGSPLSLLCSRGSGGLEDAGCHGVLKMRLRLAMEDLSKLSLGASPLYQVEAMRSSKPQVAVKQVAQGGAYLRLIEEDRGERQLLDYEAMQLCRQLQK